VNIATILRSTALLLLAGLIAGTSADAAPAHSDMQVLHRWKLGGAGGWDYLTFDAAGERLFLSRATRVDVVSAETGKVIGTIANTLGVHGIALAEDLQRGYTSNGKADSVTVFDLRTLNVIREVKLESASTSLRSTAGART
jgi:DNA-binding beta-propeller fold protein YncE